METQILGLIITAGLIVAASPGHVKKHWWRTLTKGGVIEVDGQLVTRFGGDKVKTRYFKPEPLRAWQIAILGGLGALALVALATSAGVPVAEVQQ